MYTREQLHTMLVANPAPAFSQEQVVDMIKSYIYLRRGVQINIITEFSEHDRNLMNIALKSIVRWVS